jgi:AraC-like DNA-binding protein/mannose-6-phosphate isomerase-like protein (cupin superfamily)
MLKSLEAMLRETLLAPSRKWRPEQIILGEEEHPRHIDSRPVAPGTPDAFHAHYHSMPEFCWCVSGQCVMQVGEPHFRMRAGDVCLVRRNTHHFESFVHARQDYEIVWFVFSRVTECLIVHFQYQERRYRRMQSLHLGLRAGLVRDLDALLDGDLRDRRKLAPWQRVLATFRDHLAHPPGEKQAFYFADGRRSNFQVKRVLAVQEYVRDHFAEKITLAQAARVAGCSPEYFARLFHQVNRVTFVEFLTSVRLAQAQRFMNETFLSLSEIAFRVGFNDFYYFSRTFRKYCGLSPRAFRDTYLPPDPNERRLQRNMQRKMTDDRISY